MERKESEAWSFRIGAASLGILAGMALGLVFGCFGSSIARYVFGGAVAGAITGLFYPDTAMLIVEGTVHFFMGFISANADIDTVIHDDEQVQLRPTQPWLAFAFMFGVIYAVALWVLL